MPPRRIVGRLSIGRKRLAGICRCAAGHAKLGGVTSDANDAHARPSGDAPPPLYDLDVPTPTHAERARTLAGQVTVGTLSTIAAEPEGYPYGSFVTVAFDAGNPVFLVSTLAEHTRNMMRDARASLVVVETGSPDPLANGRVTLIGTSAKVEGDEGRSRAAFLQTHPNAAYYADFRDFAFWKLSVESIRYIGGYGRMSWVESADWHAAEADPLATAADAIVTHMNEDHADAMVLYCQAFSRAKDISAAQMTAIDRYGFEMSAVTDEGPRPVRLAFPAEVRTNDEARAALIQMLKEARTRLV
jgi:putative heme iron utilization protein